METIIVEERVKTKTSYSDITDISQKRRETETTNVSKLSDITIPIRNPVSIQMSFSSKRKSNGELFQILLNKKEIGNISFDHEASSKSIVIDVADKLVFGKNELRIRTLITSDEFSEKSDIAKFLLIGEGNTVIRKEYQTKCSLEPIDQIWNLRLIK